MTEYTPAGVYSRGPADFIRIAAFVNAGCRARCAHRLRHAGQHFLA